MRPAPCSLLVSTTACLALLTAGCGGSPSTDGTGDGGATPTPKVEETVACHGAQPVDAKLAEGLSQHLQGNRKDALLSLQDWAQRDPAGQDPAAGRGFYSLGYLLDSSGQVALGRQWFDKGRALLQKEVNEAPSLEGQYYLSSLLKVLQDEQAHLKVVSAALEDLDAGRTCVEPDGDDHFRHARLLHFAGRIDDKVALLEKARAKYAVEPGLVPYRALVARELADAAKEAGDLDRWKSLALEAAELSPETPGVHRSYGLALLEAGMVGEAGEYWRKNWKKERQDGNSLVYGVRVLRDVAYYQEHFPEEAIGNLREHVTQALEQNTLFEARKVLTLRGELQGLVEADQELDPVKKREHDIADYRMNQFLMEYVRRQQDVGDLLLQNGVLGAVHHKTLFRKARPRRR
ncbi:MAG: hypothetical protein AAF533_07855 [Acidobacteriota bacterium]